MNKNCIKAIGFKEASRETAHLFDLSEVEELISILDTEFHEWANFDFWKSIEMQQWIFAIAVEVYKGEKIDIRCCCCKYINFAKDDFHDIASQKCYGIKSLYIIQKIVNEIVLAKSKRDSDGTYFV